MENSIDKFRTYQWLFDGLPQKKVIPFIHTAFQESIKKLTCIEVEKAHFWFEILPLPAIDESEEKQWEKDIDKNKSRERRIEEREAEWRNKADLWRLQSQESIRGRKERLKVNFQKCIDEFRGNNQPVTVTVDELVDKWSQHNSGLTVLEFQLTPIRVDILNPYLNDFFNKPSSHSLSLPQETDKQLAHPGFESYLKPESQYLMPFLRDNFTNKKPEFYGYLLFALKEEEALIRQLDRNKSDLHRALSKTFVNVGTYENLRKQIQSLELEQERNEDANNQINDIRLKIREVEKTYLNEIGKKL